MMGVMVYPDRPVRPPTDDFVAHSLARLSDSIHQQLGDAVVITRESVSNASVQITRISPKRPGGCPAWWIEMGTSGLDLGVGQGRRWELRRDQEAVDRIERVTAAVVKGNVVDVFGPNRSQVTVSLDDGSQLRSRELRGLLAILPAPGRSGAGRCLTPPTTS
jgi:hypothetical protein